MRSLFIAVVIGLSPLAAGSPSDAAPAKAEKPIVPQAEPVAAWLKAAKTADQELLKTVFSKRMRMKFDAEGWEKVANIYKEVFTKEFGDYRLDEFSFEFEGDENQGKVAIVHKQQKVPGLRVIKEDGVWKVNER